MDVRPAIEAAIKSLETHGGDPAAIETLTFLLEQENCEPFDPAVTDGRLTTLCDILIFG